MDCVCARAQVGREDSGKPLWYFREVLSLPVEREQPLPFFFHAGETGESVEFLCLGVQMKDVRGPALSHTQYSTLCRGGK